MKKLVIIGMSMSLWMLLVMQAVAEQPLEIATTNFPPFVYEEQGKMKGIDVDILTEVFARMQQPINIRLYPFARAVNMIKEGQADAIFPFGKDAEREQFAHYPSEVLFEMSVSLFVRKDSPITFGPLVISPYSAVLEIEYLISASPPWFTRSIINFIS